MLMLTNNTMRIRTASNQVIPMGSICQSGQLNRKWANHNVKLRIGGSVHDPTNPMGKLLFNVLAMISEVEVDLIRVRTREGMKVAKAKGRPLGKPAKLSVKQEKHLLELHAAGEHNKAELAKLFSIGRSTVFRAIERGQLRKISQEHS